MVTGNIPVSPVSAQKYVNDAADEIDSMIGKVYKTPVNMAPGPDETPPGVGTMTRPSRLLLKRVSNWLASGRLMLSTAAGGEDGELHAYALYLVNSATSVLMGIARGEIELDGAEKQDPDGQQGVYGPLISNVDPESNVEAFYDKIVLAPPNPLGWGGRYRGG
jgi:hypothetical protein